jgi:uncharacterized protein (DUF924 family)
MIDEQARQVLDYWLADAALSPEHASAQKKLWYRSNPATDADIDRLFGNLHAQAVNRDLEHWRSEPESCLALVIVLDQFSRHLYRGTSGAFAHDEQALEIAKACPAPKSLTFIGRAFLLHPFEHSENQSAQQESLKHFSELVEDADPLWRPMMENFLQHATEHQAIVLQYGRFPHRNELLGRESTPEEVDYIQSSGKTFGQSKNK